MEFALLSSGPMHDRTVIVLVTHSNYFNSLDKSTIVVVSKIVVESQIIVTLAKVA